VYLALGIIRGRSKELLGLWVGESEGAKFRLNVLTELRNRGLLDILIASIGGLKGFPEAIAAMTSCSDPGTSSPAQRGAREII
jgi:putative transposase